MFFTKNYSLIHTLGHLVIYYFSSLVIKNCLVRDFVGANKIQWANEIIYKKNSMFFCPKINFSYKWIFEQFFLEFFNNICF
jgi:hypothetical protein